MISSIVGIFGRSPITPLEQHMSKVHQCVEQLIAFFTAVFAEDWASAASLQHLIVTLENQADTMKRQLRMQLSSSLFLPIDRYALLDLLATQDLLANTSKDIAGLVIGRSLIIPPSMLQSFKEFLNACVMASAEANTAIHELDKLLETGFSKGAINVVERMLKNIGKTEHLTDDLQIKLRQELYNLESTLQPIDVMFIYQMISSVGSLANYAQDIGDKLQILLAR